jgi:four helix bundle protein
LVRGRDDGAGKSRSYRIWKSGKFIVGKDVYGNANFHLKKFGLVQQIRRAAVSIPSNLKGNSGITLKNSNNSLHLSVQRRTEAN